MSADRIVYCLERVSDYRDFERLCSALLAGTDYPGIDPLGGTGDGGRDAIIRTDAAGRRIVFASNHTQPRGRNFDLWLVNADGTGLERVTTSEEFDGFPMFSPDGRLLVFASNRNAASPGETNIFVAEWVE